MSTIKLTALDAVKLHIQQQVIRIKLIEDALRYTFEGRSMLYNKEVYPVTLQQAKNELKVLDRQRSFLEKGKTLVPYFAANSSATQRTPSTVKARTLALEDEVTGAEEQVFTSRKTGTKAKVHLNENGSIKFVELAEGERKDAARRHTTTEGTLRKQFSKHNKHNKQVSALSSEANKMATTKKNATKKANTVKKAAKKAGSASHITAADIRAAIDKVGKTKFNVAEYAEKNGNGDPAFYGRVYGAFRKHTGTMTNDGYAVGAKKAKAAPKKKAAKKAAAAKA